MSSREKRFVFHVGAHATGAWLLQRILNNNAELLRRHGVCYVARRATSRHIGHGPKLINDPKPFTRLVRHELEQPDIDTLLASHENTVGRPFDDVVSGGGLYPGAAAALEALAELSRPYRRTILLSIRPQAEFLEAYYLHTISTGGFTPFDTWLEALDLDGMSWVPLYEHLATAFGADAVRILDYRNAERGDAAYFRDFLRLADIDPPVGIRGARAHRSAVSGKALNLALAANPYLTSSDERAWMRKFLSSQFSARDYLPPTLLSDAQKAALNERYAGEYERLVNERGAHSVGSAPQSAADGGGR